MATSAYRPSPDHAQDRFVRMHAGTYIDQQTGETVVMAWITARIHHVSNGHTEEIEQLLAPKFELRRIPAAFPEEPVEAPEGAAASGRMLLTAAAP